jgi:predicted permease
MRDVGGADQMIDVFNTVVPVFTLILLGFGAGQLGWFGEGSARGLSTFVFSFAIPAMLFKAMATFGLPSSPPWAFWGAFFGAVVAAWLLAILLSRHVKGLGGAGGAPAALGAGFGNTVMLGLPLGVAHYGEAALLPMALILAVHLPLQWLAATVLAQTALVSGGSFVKALGKDLFGNPIIVAIVAGTVWNLSGVGLPNLADTTISLLSQAGVPTALFVLGLSLSRFGLKGNRAAVAVLLVIKLLVMPVVAWWLATVVFDLSRVEAGIAILFAALPAGANAYLFAERQGHGAAAVSGAIAVGTALSVVTLSGVLALLD